MLNLKEWLIRNRRDFILYGVLALFITVMHGVNQSRIHRESAALYWTHVQPQLLQRYVALQKDPKLAASIPELGQAQRVLVYQKYPESRDWAQDIESKILTVYPSNVGNWGRRPRPYKHKLQPHETLTLELDRYNQTVEYIRKTETGWLYKLAGKLVQRDPVTHFFIAK